MPQRGMRVPVRYHAVAQAVLVAAGCWGLSSSASAALCAPTASAAGGCDEVMEGTQPSVGVPSLTTATEPVAAKPGVSAASEAAPQEEVEFNPAFFKGNGADLSHYARGNPVSPGVYGLDLSVNGKGRGRFDVQFQAVPGSDIAAPCFTLADLDRIGVDVERVIKQLKESSKQADFEPSPSVCHPFAQTVPGATAYFNSADLKLDLTVPQLEMRKEADGYVDPSRWDEGIDAGLVQYSLATYTSHQHEGPDLTSAYLGLRSGINIEGWRFRQWSTASWQNRSSGMHWQSVALFAQHDLTALKSQLTLGDSSTSGDVFDTFNVRGVQVSSDDRMLPDSVSSYAPVVRGVADTNARVTVRQNNIIITETSVPPGPFELSDLPATGYGGDLQVTVTEADGRQRTFSVPFASVPQLLRPGASRFNVTAGAYRDQVLSVHPGVAQVVYQRGLSNLLTGYTGAQVSAGYWSGLLGVALNTPAGAFAFDVTVARTDLGEGSKPGYSARITYSKLLPGYNTNFSVAAYRYSTSRFYSLTDAIYARNQWAGQSLIYDLRTRNRVQVNVSQPLGDYGSVYLSGSSQNYWESGKNYDLQYQAGFSSVFKRISYSVYAQRSRLQTGSISTQVGLNLTIPLGRVDSNRHQAFDYVTTNLALASGGDSTLQATASGRTAGVTPINYGVTASRIVTGDDQTVMLGGNGMYRAPFGTYSANASVGNESSQAALNADGAVVIHRGGVTLSPPLGQASALIEAKGAKGGTIINGQGATIDGNGYAVVSSLRPYRVNTVGLDPSAVPLDVELNNTSEEVVPRADSLVLVKMATVQGRPTFATVKDEHGKLLPMGAELVDESGKSVGIVGQGGMAFLHGLEGEGKLDARWGTASGESCVLPYTVPKQDKAGDNQVSSVAHISSSCDPSLIWSPPPGKATSESSPAAGAGRSD